MRALVDLLSRYEPSYPKVVRGYSAAEIAQLEHVLGRPVPPAYRDFLETAAANIGFSTDLVDFDIEEVIYLAESKREMLEGLGGLVTPIAEDSSPGMSDYYIHLGRPAGNGDGEIVRSASGINAFKEWRIGCPSLRCLLLGWGFSDLRMVPLTARAHMTWRPLEGSSRAKIKAQVSALMLRQGFTYLDVTQTPALDLHERGDCAVKVRMNPGEGLVGLYLAGQDRDEVERIAETMLDNVRGRAWRSPLE